MTTEIKDLTSREPSTLDASDGSLLPGLMIVIAGAVQGDGALLTAAYRGSSLIADDQLSFPWDGATAITTSVVWGTTQLLLVLGLVAFARSGAPAGRGRVGVDSHRCASEHGWW